MFRKFEEAQAQAAQAAGEVDGCSEASTVSESTTVFGTCEPSNTSGVSERSNAPGSPESTNALAIPEPFNSFGAPSTFNTLATSETSNIFGLRESPDMFDDKPSFNFATTSGGDLVLLDSQGSKVSVLATYAIPSKDRMPTFEGEVVRRGSASGTEGYGAEAYRQQDFFRDWTREQLDEEQKASISAGDRQDTITNRQAARLRLRRKRFDFVGGPGYRVYLARRVSVGLFSGVMFLV